MERVGQVSKNASALIMSKLVTSSLFFLLAIFINKQLGPKYAGVYAYGYTLYTMFQVLPDFGIGNISVRDISQNHQRVRKYFPNVVNLRLRLAGLAFVLITITNIAGTLIQRSDPLSGPRFWVVLAISFCLLVEQPFSNSLAENFIGLEKLTTVAYVYLIMGILRVTVSFFVVSQISAHPSTSEAVRVLVLLMVTYIGTMIYSIIHFFIVYRRTLATLEAPPAGKFEKALAEAIGVRPPGQGGFGRAIVADYSLKSMSGVPKRGIFTLDDLKEPDEIPLEWMPHLSRRMGPLKRGNTPRSTPGTDHNSGDAKKSRRTTVFDKNSAACASSVGHAGNMKRKPTPDEKKECSGLIPPDVPGGPVSAGSESDANNLSRTQQPAKKTEAVYTGRRGFIEKKEASMPDRYLKKGESKKATSPELMSNKELRRYLLVNAWPLAVVSLGVAIYASLDVPILAWIKGNTSVGLYNAGSMFAKAFAFLTLAVNMAVLPAVSVVGGKYPERLGKIWEKLLLYAFVVTMPLAVIIPVIARPVLLVQKHQFSQAWIVVWLTMAAMCFTVMTAISFPFFVVINKQKRITTVVMISIVLKAALNLILIPLFDFRGAAITALTSEAAAFSLIYFLLSRELRYRSAFPRLVPLPVISWGILYITWFGLYRFVFSAKHFYQKLSGSAVSAISISAAVFLVYVITVILTRTISKPGLNELNQLLKVEG